MPAKSPLIIEIRERLACVALRPEFREAVAFAGRMDVAHPKLTDPAAAVRKEIRESRWCLPDAVVLDVSEIENATGMFISILLSILREWSRPGMEGVLVAAPAFQEVWQAVRLSEKWPVFANPIAAEDYLRSQLSQTGAADSGSRGG